MGIFILYVFLQFNCPVFLKLVGISVLSLFEKQELQIQLCSLALPFSLMLENHLV